MKPLQIQKYIVQGLGVFLTLVVIIAGLHFVQLFAREIYYSFVRNTQVTDSEYKTVMYRFLDDGSYHRYESVDTSVAVVLWWILLICNPLVNCWDLKGGLHMIHKRTCCFG